MNRDRVFPTTQHTSVRGVELGVMLACLLEGIHVTVGVDLVVVELHGLLRLVGRGEVRGLEICRPGRGVAKSRGSRE